MTPVETKTIEAQPDGPKTTAKYDQNRTLAQFSCFVLAINCAAIFVPAVLAAVRHHDGLAGILTFNIFLNGVSIAFYLSDPHATNKLRALQFLAFMSFIALCRSIGLF